MINRREYDVFPKIDPKDYYQINDMDLNRCSPKQRSYIYSLLEKAGVEEDELFATLGIDCEEVKELTSKEASEAISVLKEQLHWN